MSKKVVKKRKTVQKTTPVQANEAKNLTDDVADRRRRELDDNFPQLNPNEFASEEAYRKALLEQYQAMRQQEYQYVCLNEGLKAYDVSVSICNRTGNSRAMNKATWDGCKNIMKKYPDMKEAVADSCYARIPEHVTNTLSGANANCCAVSSKALESKISAEMGFDGNDNFVQPYQQASNAGHHRMANGFMKDPALKGYTEHGDLWTMVSEGKVGPGATIAIPSRTASGYHAKTVIAVNYDENGNLKNYVLQANNRTSLEVVSSRVIYSNVYAGDMNRWMGGQLNREMEQNKELSTAELEQMVSQERSKLGERVDDLEKTENHLFATKGNQKQVLKYADSYIKNANVPSATPAIMLADAENAATEAQRQEARVFGHTFFNSTVATHTNRETTTSANSVEVPTEGRVTRNDSISDKDLGKMRSMLNNLNKSSKKSQFDIESTIAALTELYGADASKVLTKIMMAPAHFAQNLDLRNENGKPVKSSREVLEQLCKPQTEEVNQQILAIAAAKKRGLDMA